METRKQMGALQKNPKGLVCGFFLTPRIYAYRYYGMTTQPRRQAILPEMNASTRMERGKLCTQSPGPSSPPCHKLQCWHQGKNHTRYVPRDEVPALQQALAGHQRFQQLAAEFVDVTVAMTRQEQEADRKKNSRQSKPNATGKPKPS